MHTSYPVLKCPDCQTWLVRDPYWLQWRKGYAKTILRCPKCGYEQEMPLADIDQENHSGSGAG